MARTPSCGCGVCKKCKHRIYMREWYQRKTPEERRAWIALRDPERVKKADRERSRNDPVRIAKHRERNRGRKVKPEADPVKRSARKKVSRAVAKGTLVRPTVCSGCGNDDIAIHAHHTDYSKPLDVTWLCPSCHGKAHRIYD